MKPPANPPLHVLAVDLGASDGRAVLGSFDGAHIETREIHRFPNEPVRLGGTLYWDFLRLFHEVKESIALAAREVPLRSVAVSAWGCDFGLLDGDGHLLENPVHYGDGRTAEMPAHSAMRIPPGRLHRITGAVPGERATAMQLLALRENRVGMLSRAETMLPLPDLFHYFLCGKRATEASIASTTLLFDTRRREWSREAIGALGLPERIFPPVAESCSILGALTPALCEELGVEGVQVATVAEHSLQSALLAAPATGEDFAFACMDSEGALGCELFGPPVVRAPLESGFTFACGCENRLSLHRELPGLRLLDACREQWRREGRDYSMRELCLPARDARPLQALIDPAAPELAAGDGLPERIRAFCARTGQPEPRDDGATARCVLESLALCCRAALEALEDCTGYYQNSLLLLGEGAELSLPGELLAGALRIRVNAAPFPAAAMGSIAGQLIALRAIADVDKARRIIAASTAAVKHRPTDRAAWDAAYKRYQEVCTC